MTSGNWQLASDNWPQNVNYETSLNNGITICEL